MDDLGVPHLPRRRRRHSPQFKARIVAACRAPGVSIARVALDHGLNDNMVRRWIKAADDAPAPAKPDFIPLALPAPATQTRSSSTQDSICIEVSRAGGTVTVRWPTSEAERATAFLRELLL